MMKRQNKIIVIIGALMILASLAWMAEPYYTWAQVQNDAHPCRVAVEYEGDSLFKLENMNPGDETTRRVKVIKTGTASAHLYMTWDYVDGNPELGFEGSLYEQLYLQIWETDQDGNRINLIYDGIMAGAPHYQEDIADRLIGYLEHNDELFLEFTVYLPGATTGNVFQGSTLDTKLVFYTICSGEENAKINIEKDTNGSDADVPTGPFIPVGGNVTWTYIITNTGNVPLSNVTVTDNKPGVNPVYVSGDINDDDILQVEEVWTYRATGVAFAGQYANIGSVEGASPKGVKVEDDDPSHYYGITTDETEINIEKYTNGVDADLPTGPQIAVGGNVTWTYVVTNPNTIPLYNIVVTDNRAGVNPVYISGDLNSDNILQPDEVWTYRATSIAVAGQYANIGSVVGETINGKVVTDTDPSHYFGFITNTPDIDIEKYTNDIDADVPTGPFVPVGNTVTWTYIITNTGNKPLSNVTVTDNMSGVNPVYVSGDTNGDDILQVDEVWTFRATGIAVAGQYANIGSVEGTSPEGVTVEDEDPSHYFGTAVDTPVIQIEKATNGVDADLPTGPIIPIGATVTWTYVVTNPGNVPLSNVTVTDNIAGVNPIYISGDVNADLILQPGETWLYRATGTALVGQYANIGRVVGTPPTGPNVNDDDPSHYFGVSTPTPPPPPPPGPTPPPPGPTPPPPAPTPPTDPVVPPPPDSEIDLDPDDPLGEPDPEEPDEDDASSVIVDPEGPRSDPPLPRTDGVSIGLFVAGLLLLFAGAFMTKSREEDEEQKA